MRVIALQPIPNQSLSVVLDTLRYNLTIKEAKGIMVIDIVRNNEVILEGQRMVPGVPLIPFKYLEEGNFVLLTENEDYPYYTEFGSTQTLCYLTIDEINQLT